MTRQELQTKLDHHKLTIDGYHGGAGKFRDLEVGVGADPQRLAAFAADVRAYGLACTITHVTNDEHPDHGKPYAELQSFWWEEQCLAEPSLAEPKGDVKMEWLEKFKADWKRNADESERNQLMDSGWSQQTAQCCTITASRLMRELIARLAKETVTPAMMFDQPSLVQIMEAANYVVTSK